MGYGSTGKVSKAATEFTNRMQKHRAEKRNIEYPPPKDYAARCEAEKDLAVWVKRYAPEAFCLNWAGFHLTTLHKLQVGIENGGFQAIALPRGSGKTTMCKWAALWALCTGHKDFVLFVCATGRKGEAMIRDVKSILRFNPHLYDDYPEICAPIRELEGVTMRASTQTAYGEPTMIDLGAGKLVMPTSKRVDEHGEMHDNPASGSIIWSTGITGDIRGAQITTPDGQVLRPNFVIGDDPQTRESAKSKDQTTFRIQSILGDIGGSEGTEIPITIAIPCTIIYRGDLADQLLDTDLHPDFRGECHPLLTKLPDNMELWEDYNKERIAGLEEDDNGKRADAYYVKNQKALDEGIDATWQERTLGRVSATQYAMDKYFTLGKNSFMAEYQNQPEDLVTLYDINEKLVMTRTNGFRRNDVPENVQVICGFADINRAGLHWCLTGFTDPLTGHILDYGKYPKRGDLWRANANQVEIRKAIHEGLENLLQYVNSLKLTKGKDVTKPNVFLIDAGYESEAVYNFVRFAQFPFSVLASRGVAHHRYNQNHKTAVANSQRDGCHQADSNHHQFLVHDACRWREFTQKGFLSVVGAPGSCSIYGTKGNEHRVFAEHLCAEKLVDVAVGDTGKVYKWATSPNPHDYLDALVGTFVGAAWLGFTQAGKIEEKVIIRRPARRGKR